MTEKNGGLVNAAQNITAWSACGAVKLCGGVDVDLEEIDQWSRR